MRILTVDPGTRLIAWAVGDTPGPQLRASGLEHLRGAELAERVVAAGGLLHALVGRWRPERLVVELPRPYSRAPVRASDVVDLALFAGACLVAAQRDEEIEAVLVPAVAWKGSVPKPIHQARLLERLPATALAQLGERPNHNLVDAVGLLWWAAQGAEE